MKEDCFDFNDTYLITSHLACVQDACERVCHAIVIWVSQMLKLATAIVSTGCLSSSSQ